MGLLGVWVGFRVKQSGVERGSGRYFALGFTLAGSYIGGWGVSCRRVSDLDGGAACSLCLLIAETVMKRMKHIRDAVRGVYCRCGQQWR